MWEVREVNDAEGLGEAVKNNSSRLASARPQRAVEHLTFEITRVEPRLGNLAR